MDERVFKECTEELVKLGENLKEVLKQLENPNQDETVDQKSQILHIKESFEFISHKLNTL